jgi:AcrR family transcriptional regulator
MDVNPVDRPSLAELKAEATRRAIVEAAAELFRERGYRSTTMEAIAHAAGVAVQTLYNSLGSKAAILSRVLDVAIVGDHDDVPLLARVGSRIGDVTDPRLLVADLVATAATIHERTAWIFHVIATAVDDPEIAVLQRRNEEQRLQGYTFAAEQLRSRRGLRPGLSVEDAAARIWTIANPQTYRFLVAERGWSRERYRTWLEEALAATLLR